MEDDIYARVIEEAEFIAETGATVRGKGFSRFQVHRAQGRYGADC